MARTQEGRQRWHAPAPNNRLDPAPNLTAAPDSRHPAGRVQLRTDPGCCPACAAPLEGTPVERRSWSVLRSGDYIGDRAEWRYHRCDCGTLNRVLHAVHMARWRGRAA